MMPLRMRASKRSPRSRAAQYASSGQVRRPNSGNSFKQSPCLWLAASQRFKIIQRQEVALRLFFLDCEERLNFNNRRKSGHEYKCMQRQPSRRRNGPASSFGIRFVLLRWWCRQGIERCWVLGCRSRYQPAATLRRQSHCPRRCIEATLQSPAFRFYLGVTAVPTVHRRARFGLAPFSWRGLVLGLR
jgi:hypothetical protein